MTPTDDLYAKNKRLAKNFRKIMTRDKMTKDAKILSSTCNINEL